MLKRRLGCWQPQIQGLTACVEMLWGEVCDEAVEVRGHQVANLLAKWSMPGDTTNREK